MNLLGHRHIQIAIGAKGNRHCVSESVAAFVVEVSVFLAGSQRRAFPNAIATCALPLMPPEPHSNRLIAELTSRYDNEAPGDVDLALI